MTWVTGRAAGLPLGSPWPKASGRRWVKPQGPRPQYGSAHQRERAKWAKVKDKVCGICHRPILQGQPWHLDHVVPVKLGGADGPRQPAHRFCNLSKGSRL